MKKVDEIKVVEMELSKYATEDFQKRGGKFPESDIPVSIDVNGSTLSASFKNTNEESAKSWCSTFVRNKGFEVVDIDAEQDGDYHNDWVMVYVTVAKLENTEGENKMVNVEIKTGNVVELNNGKTVKVNEIETVNGVQKFIGTNVKGRRAVIEFKLDDVKAMQKVVEAKTKKDETPAPAKVESADMPVAKTPAKPKKQVPAKTKKAKSKQEVEFTKWSNRIKNKRNKKVLEIEIGEFSVQMYVERTGDVINDIKAGYDETSTDWEFMEGDTDFAMDLTTDATEFYKYIKEFEPAREQEFKSWLENIEANTNISLERWGKENGGE